MALPISVFDDYGKRKNFYIPHEILGIIINFVNDAQTFLNFQLGFGKYVRSKFMNVFDNETNRSKLVTRNPYNIVCRCVYHLSLTKRQNLYVKYGTSDLTYMCTENGKLYDKFLFEHPTLYYVDDKSKYTLMFSVKIRVQDGIFHFTPRYIHKKIHILDACYHRIYDINIVKLLSNSKSFKGEIVGKCVFRVKD